MCIRDSPCPFVLPRAHDPAHWTRQVRPCVRDAFCCPCSPWSCPFPPPPPPPRPRRCSAASQVLQACPTSHDRSFQDYRLGVAWTSRPVIHLSLIHI